MIGIVNYGAGNIRAITNILEASNVDFKIISKSTDFDAVNKLILPGVGSFDHCMKALKNSGLLYDLNKLVVDAKTPILGICIGLHLMLEKSDEGVINGLGWIPGKVERFNEDKINSTPKLPHMGWNSVQLNNENELFRGVDLDKGFYFVHSYYASDVPDNYCIAVSYHGETFTCALKKENIYAVQFHPEKSHSNGQKLLLNFVNL